MEDAAAKLDEAWKERNVAFEAIVAYSDSLEAIVSSANKGRETGGKLADSIKGFAETVGIAIPGSPAAIEAATDSIKLVAYHIANIRAARSLEEARHVAQNDDLDERLKMCDQLCQRTEDFAQAKRERQKSRCANR